MIQSQSKLTVADNSGDGPPTLGKSNHNVPARVMRSPGAPKLIPMRWIVPGSIVLSPHDDHCSWLGGIATRASAVGNG